MYFILDISGEFKVMHFTSSNLLHDFLNGKYMLFFIMLRKSVGWMLQALMIWRA